MIWGVIKKKLAAKVQEDLYPGEFDEDKVLVQVLLMANDFDAPIKPVWCEVKEVDLTVYNDSGELSRVFVLHARPQRPGQLPVKERN